MISALIELQRLKRLDRTGWVLRGLAPGTESVAAHSYGVAVTAMFIADEVIARGGQIDAEHVLRMALLHDAAEVRVGDMPRTATEYFGSGARKSAESAAFEEIVGTLNEQVREKYVRVHTDYEYRSSVEAKIVKAADLLDLLVQVLALERAGARGLEEFWEGVLGRSLDLEEPAAGVIRECLDRLVSEREKVFALSSSGKLNPAR